MLLVNDQQTIPQTLAICRYVAKLGRKLKLGIVELRETRRMNHESSEDYPMREDDLFSLIC